MSFHGSVKHPDGRLIPLPNAKSLLPPHPDLDACFAGMATSSDDATTTQVFADMVTRLGRLSEGTFETIKLAIADTELNAPVIDIDSCPPELFNEDGSPRIVDYINMLKGPAQIVSGHPAPTMRALDVQLNDIIREGIDNGMEMLNWDEKEFQLTDPTNLNEVQQKIFDRYTHNIKQPFIDMEAPLSEESRAFYRSMRPGHMLTDQFGGGVIPKIWPEEDLPPYDLPSTKGMPKVAIYKKRRPHKRRNQNTHR